MKSKLYKDYPRAIVAVDYDGTLVDDNEDFFEDALKGLKKVTR